MKTGTRNLVIVASCIVVLGGTAVALALTGGGSSTASSTASSTPTIDLVSKKIDDIESMSVKNKKGSYTLIPVVIKTAAAAASGSSSASSGSTETTTYTVKGLEGVPLDSSAAEQVMQNGFNLVASKNLGTVSNMEEFGLTNPQAAVEVKFKDGSTYNYKIGNVCATDSTSYYMSGEKSANVYVVSVDSGLLEDSNYFVKKDILSIQNSSGENDFTEVKLSGKNYPQPIVIQKSGSDDKMTAPISILADSNNYSAIKTALASLTAASVVKTNPTEADLKAYGLDQPSAVAEFTVNKGSYKLSLGAQKNGNYYAMLDKINVVYSVASSGVSAWAKADLFSLRSKLVLIPNISTVKAITVSQKGKTTSLSIARTKDETKSTQDKPQYTYKVTTSGGKAVDYEKAYQPFYEGLISLELLEQSNGKPSGTPDYSIEYQYFDKTATDKVEFYKNGDRRYLTVVNGTVYGNVTSPDLEKVLYDYRQLG